MLTRDALLKTLQNALVSLLAYLGGYYLTALFHLPSAALGGLWALISGLVVLRETDRETWSSAGLRVIGTLVGAVISSITLLLFPFCPLAMALAIGVTVLLCQFMGIPDHARLAALTVGVIMVISSLHPDINPVLNALFRFMESLIGTVVAVAVALLFPDPDRT
jgi:uncharacterized membrane protein YgaE (UPF0421/DUF939 family)